MFIKISALITGILIIFAILVATQPDEFRISRSVSVAATPLQVFAQVSDFHLWQNWSPWAKLDPEMKTTFEGPSQGEGSIYTWSGNDKVGRGKMTFTKVQSPDLIQLKVEFLKPMKATNDTEFTFKSDSRGTLVTWSMSGRNSFVAKAFSLFVNVEKMIGPEFEKGLAQLKNISESATQQGT